MSKLIPTLLVRVEGSEREAEPSSPLRLSEPCDLAIAKVNLPRAAGSTVARGGGRTVFTCGSALAGKVLRAELILSRRRHLLQGPDSPR